MKVGTFFSGIGSPEQALINLGIKHEIEFACDIDKYAKETYLKNYKPKEFYNDITSLDMKKLSYVDLLVFGFPCQSFSTAGKRGGFEDTRGTLFYDALRYLRQHKPRYFIAENVKGLISHDKGRTFRTIIDCLAKTENYQMSLLPFENLGYHIHYKVLNTKDFGLPQNRERIFIVGIRDDKDNNFNFPKEIPLELKLKDLLQDNPDFKLYDDYNSNFINNEVIGTLTCNSGSKAKRNGFKIIETNAKSGLYQPHPRNYKELGLKRVEQFEERKDNIANCIDTGNTQFIKVDEKYYLSDKGIENLKKNQLFNKFSPLDYNSELAGCITARCNKVSNDNNFIEVDEKYYLSDEKIKKLQEYSKRQKENGNGFTAKFHNTETENMSTLKASYQGVDDLIITHCLQQRSAERPSIKKNKNAGGTGHLKKEDGTTYCLDTGNTQAIEYSNRIRRLTPIECERLQGFKDNFTEGVSDTQRYKQLGNTISVPVIQAILNKLL
mgnify:CR=1 FL=1